jgi:hypothetical protein
MFYSPSELIELKNPLTLCSSFNASDYRYRQRIFQFHCLFRQALFLKTVDL